MILPGSCIKPVYEQTDREYREIEETGKKELDRIVSAAVGKLSMDRDGIVVMNTQGYERDDVVTVYGEEALPALEDEQGRNVPLQRMADGSYLLYAEHVPPLGYQRSGETHSPHCRRTTEIGKKRKNLGRHL